MQNDMNLTEYSGEVSSSDYDGYSYGEGVMPNGEQRILLNGEEIQRTIVGELNRIRDERDEAIAELDKQLLLYRSHQELINDIRQAVRTELLVGDKPMSRLAGVLRDVGCEIPGWPVSSNQCRSAVHDITMNLLDRLHSEDGDAGQYDCLITMASAICAFAEHIKREGALK
jgi:hypothetical protein